MKYLFFILFTCFYSHNSFSDWKHMYQDKKFDEWYLDFTKIHRINDHVFYQTLVDHNDNKIFPSSITYILLEFKIVDRRCAITIVVLFLVKTFKAS